jgi:hypothetical protein
MLWAVEAHQRSGPELQTSGFVVGAPAFPGSPAAKLAGVDLCGGRSASALQETVSTRSCALALAKFIEGDGLQAVHNYFAVNAALAAEGTISTFKRLFPQPVQRPSLDEGTARVLEADTPRDLHVPWPGAFRTLQIGNRSKRRSIHILVRHVIVPMIQRVGSLCSKLKL